MKKILAVVLIIIIVIALLPIVGNKLVKNELNDRVELLLSQGIEVSQSTVDSTYFNTKQHYEFLVKDTEKFMNYLSQFADAQLPPYVNALLDGILIGVDVQYSNFPISSGVFIDIYPLSLSETTMKNIQEDDINFYTYVKNLLQNRGVLYHINYNIVEDSFDGYIKNIKEEYVLKDGSKVTLELLNASYEGSGTLMAPDRLSTRIETVRFNVVKGSEEFSLLLKEFSNSSTFESQSTYNWGAKLENMEFYIKGSMSKDATVKLKDLHLNASSNTQGDKAEYNVKTSFHNLDIFTKVSKLQASDFNYDIFLNNVDKPSMEELRVLLSELKISRTKELDEKIQESIVNIISKGLTLSIADFSLDEISLDDSKMIKGFSLKSKLDITEDADLAQKLKNSPLMIVQNIELEAKVKFSKALSAVINKELPISTMANSYAEEEDEDFVFNIKFKQGQLTVNDKLLQ